MRSQSDWPRLWYDLSVTTTPPDALSTEPPDRPRLLAVEIGDWPGLEQPVRLELDARQTVLVGKNGAGKSLLMEGLFLAARQAVRWHYTSPTDPRVFRCDVEQPAGPAFGYQYQVEEKDLSKDSDLPANETEPWASFPPWSERGFRLDDGTELWRVAGRMLSIKGKPPERVPRGISSLFGIRDNPEIGTEVQHLTRLLFDFRSVRPGTLRREDGNDHDVRRAVLVQRNEVRGRRGQWDWGAVGFSEVDDLGEHIVTLWDKNPPLYQELVEILCGLGLVRKVAVDVYKDPHNGRAKEARADLAAVLFDGTNLGLCSDGTLRVAQIVIELVRPEVSCLLIEEPETAVHPGLLDKLLALIETYSTDRQIILSTHSPQVVDRFAPHQLRLVERESGVTRVHSLSAADRALAISYLRDQGSLADFIFRRSEA
jgi:hypothetical protein